MKQPLVYIIILNWNGLNWLKQCLPSVLATDYPNYKILLVDNGSTDDSVKWIKENYPNIELIENKRNYGFAEGNNIGIRYALKHSADYMALLNTDIKVDPSWLKELVKVGERNKKIGMLGCKVLDFQGKKIQNVGFSILPNGKALPIGEGKDPKLYSKIKEVDYIGGAAILIKKQTLEKVGLFDPVYFMHSDDKDLGFRAKRQGYLSVSIPNALVYHYSGGSTEKTKKWTIRWLILRNRIRFVFKNFSFKKVLFFLFKFEPKNILHYLRKGYFGLLFLLPFAYIWNLIRLPQTLYYRWSKRKLL